MASMIIRGLSLLVPVAVLVACGGSSGTGGTGGAAGAEKTGSTTTGAGGAGGAAITNACVDAADKKIAADTKAVNAAATTCGGMCISSKTIPACVSTCMAAQVKFSTLCADCWGDVIACGISHCIADCAGGMTPACTTCTDKFCTPAFKACSGTP